MTALTNFCILLLICHFLGDYQLQWEALAKEKTEKPLGMLKHLGIHFGLLSALCVWGLIQGLGLSILWPVLLVFGVHVGTDILKKRILRSTGQKTTYRAKVALYLVDQLLHLTAIVLASQLFFVEAAHAFSIGSFLTRDMLNWVLLFVLLDKPANVTFKVLFEKYQYKEVEEPVNSAAAATNTTTERIAVGVDPQARPEPLTKTETLDEPVGFATIPGAGALIGTMERFLSAIFLSAGQWAAIGIVFTAKSVARFKQIERNKQFAEYYLIGTLYSILYVVALYFVVMKL